MWRLRAHDKLTTAGVCRPRAVRTDERTGKPDPNGPVLFNARVAWEVTKTVWTKEALGPPPLAKFGEAQKQLLAGINTVRTLKFLDWTVHEAAKKALAGFHIVAFFVVGEMVGRRSIVGYKA